MSTPVVPPSMTNSYGIICDAMKDVGKLRAGQVPDGEILMENQRRLNKLINYYMTQGLKLWLLQDTNVPLVPPLSAAQGVALYTFGPSGTNPMPKPLRVKFGYFLYNASSAQAGTQYPLIPMSYPDEYQTLSQTLQPGSVTSYAVNKQQSTLNVYLWNPADAFTASNGSVHFVFEMPVTNFTGLTDQMNFPIEWALLLEWGLADQIKTGQPLAVQANVSQMAAKYQAALEDWDVEDADTSIQPDQRTYQGYGRFK